MVARANSLGVPWFGLMLDVGRFGRLVHKTSPHCTVGYFSRNGWRVCETVSPAMRVGSLLVPHLAPYPAEVAQQLQKKLSCFFKTSACLDA